jgi:hypothetical protein
MNIRFISLCLIAAAFLAASPGFAKGTTVELTIAGPGLEAPIHTTDPVAISAMVWGTNFFQVDAGPVPGPKAGQAPFDVYFWVGLPRQGPIQLKYVVHFFWETEGDQGVVCFPGRRSPWYQTNTRSILREGIDGHCFLAEEEWGKAIRGITSSRSISAGDSIFIQAQVVGCRKIRAVEVGDVTESGTVTVFEDITLEVLGLTSDAVVRLLTDAFAEKAGYTPTSFKVVAVPESDHKAKTLMMMELYQLRSSGCGIRSRQDWQQPIDEGELGRIAGTSNNKCRVVADSPQRSSRACNPVHIE